MLLEKPPCSLPPERATGLNRSRGRGGQGSAVL
jgi:hypothetical protein